jgi:hypothetical protein
MLQQKHRASLIALAASLLLLPTASALASDARGLRGSRASMRRQHAVAERNDFTFLRTVADVLEFVRTNRLEPLFTSSTVLVNDAMFPYARPQVVLFIQRLAEQYHEATGYRLVVTSLTRPYSRQPRNASPLSVHPAGMAVDLHVPGSKSARMWLEYTLLSLESKGLIDATREHYPSHYHVAVFPQRYEEHVARITGATGDNATLPSANTEDPAPPAIVSLEPSDSASEEVAPRRLQPLASETQSTRSTALWLFHLRFLLSALCVSAAISWF